MSENHNPGESEFKIDLSYLHDVSSGSNEFMIEMIELFLEQTPAYFEQLNRFIAEEDWTRVAEIAHKIKPTLAFMGADAAKESMADIESKARSLKNTDSISPAFKSLYAFSEELYVKLIEVKNKLTIAD